MIGDLQSVLAGGFAVLIAAAVGLWKLWRNAVERERRAKAEAAAERARAEHASRIRRAEETARMEAEKRAAQVRQEARDGKRDHFEDR